ncbi:MAG TPA: LamG domain-containing protein [Bacteroidia bacterium]|nr:LamG domain-containing protein [Bacteroidia bacterium]
MISLSSVVFSCTKTDNVHDTTTTVITDTIVTKDTVYDITDGLVAYFNFNGGTLKDSSGLHNDIVLNSATMTTDRFGNANNAYLFDGTSSYMTVKNSSSLNPSNITLFAIIKVNGFYTGSCDGNQVLSKGYPYNINGFYSIQFFDYSSNCGVPPTNINNETFSAIYGDDNPQGAGAGVWADSVIIKTGSWYYLTYTYDGTTAKFYINGQLKDSVNKSVPFTPNTNDLFIGKHENPPFPYYFNGVIDEIRIYNKALKPGAVLALSNLKE